MQLPQLRPESPGQRRAGARSVSWFGLLLVTLIAGAAGLAGNAQIVGSLESNYYRRSADHSQRLATQDLLPAASAAFAATDSTTGALRRFRERASELVRNSESEVYLVDLSRSVAIPIVPAQSSTKLPLDSLPVSVPGWVVWTEAGGGAVLVHLSLIELPPQAPPWQLAIVTDISEQLTEMHRLHYQISTVLLLAIALIALGSVVILRRLGRGYELGLERALDQRTAQLEAAHVKILHQARLAILGQTASLLAHEIRNPLASIKFGLSGVAGADYLPERDARRLNIVLDEVDHLNGMLTETLDYVRPVRLSEEPVALDRLVVVSPPDDAV